MRSMHDRIAERGDPTEVHASRADLDEEQGVETSQRGGVDAQEVGRDDALGLGLDELLPCWPRPVWCRFDTGCAKNAPNGRSCDLVAESGEFAMDAAVTPRGVL